MSSAGPSIRRLIRAAWEHPEALQPIKTAAAVAIAWALVHPLPGVADHYPYYAPLGALLAVSGTVTASVRDSAKVVVAMLLGAPVAWAFDLLLPTNVATLAAVVALATLLSRWRWLGNQAGWAPVAAMFVMIVGRGDPGQYIAAYVGLIAFGAVIGVAVDLLLPSLPLNATQSAVERLRNALADQLNDLADGLRLEGPPTGEQWEQRRRGVAPLTDQMQRTVNHMAEARRANWRAGRWRAEADRQYCQARALEQLAWLVQDLTTLVTGEERAGLDRVAMGPSVRPLAADTLEAMADTLRSVQGNTGDPKLLRRTDSALRRLVEEIRKIRHRTGDDMFTAGDVVVTVRKALASLAPEELVGTVPAGESEEAGNTEDTDRAPQPDDQPDDEPVGRAADKAADPAPQG